MNSHILAEFFNQSRSETVLEKDGPVMDKTCKFEIVYFFFFKKKGNASI